MAKQRRGMGGGPRGSAFGIPRWLWEQFNRPAIFIVFMYVGVAPGLVAIGVNATFAVSCCSGAIVCYIGWRCWSAYLQYQNSAIKLERASLDILSKFAQRTTMPPPDKTPQLRAPPDEEGLD